MTGMLACRFPAHGLLACLLLAFLALTWDLRKIALFTASFCLGLAFAFAMAPAVPTPETVPAWVKKAATPDGKASDAAFSDGLALTGTVVENSPLAGNRARLILEDVRAAGEEAPLPGRLVLSWQYPPPDLAAAGPGQRLSATLRIREIRGFANPGTWETESYWRDKDAYFRAWSRDDGARNGKNPPYALKGEASLFWRLREGLRDKTLAVLAKDGRDTMPLSQAGSVIPALLFGDRSLLGQKSLDLVARSTLAHSLALSGMHLGFAAALGYGAAYLLSFLFPSLFLRLPRQKAGLLLALPLCLCYLWIGGAPPSLVRAALMLLFWGVLLWVNRPKVLLDGLLWAVACILLVSPAALFDIRLQLSAVSVAGIALAAPLLASLARQPRRQPLGTMGNAAFRLLLVVAGMAVISLAAQTAVLPLVLDAFPGTGLWFPLNLLWLPLLGMWVMPASFAGLLMTALHLPAAASFLFSLAQIPCEALFFLLDAMDAAGILVSPVALRPAFPAAAGYWLLLLCIPIVASSRAFSRRTLPLFCLGLFLVSGPTLWPMLTEREEMVQLQLIDVGQGQAVAVTWRTGGKRGRMLVDGGGFASPFFDVGRQVVTPVLTDNTAPRLDWIVNSHPDTDHLQGLLFPMETFMLGCVASGPDTVETDTLKTDTTGTETEDSGTAAKRPLAVTKRDEILRRRAITPVIWRAEDVIALAPGLALEVLHPGEDGKTLSANDSALVLRLVWRGRSLALVCGDLERKGINQLLGRNAPLEADVLVLPHHGSAGSFNPKLYDAARPALALVSCGYANAWHFPAEPVREALAERDIPLASTADKGQITVRWDKTFAMRTDYARK